MLFINITHFRVKCFQSLLLSNVCPGTSVFNGVYKNKQTKNKQKQTDKQTQLPTIYIYIVTEYEDEIQSAQTCLNEICDIV